METDKLSTFAAQCSAAILTVYPHWRNYIVSDTEEKRPHQPNDNDFIIEIPSRSRSDHKPLFVHTDSDFEYLIVGLGPGWAEFADWHEDRGIEGVVSDALNCVKDIMDEKLVGVRLKRGWRLFQPEQLGQYNDVWEVVSWKGTFDFHRDA